MAIDNGRKAAFEALNDVLVKRAYADLAAKERFKGVEEREARFGRKLLYQTLDRLIAIDSVLDPMLDKENTPERIVNALRMGVCQLLYMNSVPDFAALDSTVELVKLDGFESRSGLANAVLRNVIREGKQVKLPDVETDPAGHLSVKYSWPRFVVELWLKEQPAHAEALLAYEPKFHATLRANALKGGTAAELEAALQASGAEVERGSLVPDAFRVKGHTDLTGWDLFRAGKITAQGEASQLVSHVAAQVAGQGGTVLDACAAPGGKSAAIASELEGNCAITAWEVHPHRLKLMQETFKRLGVASATPELHDARFSDHRQFDLVLVDAPCSGLGVAWGSPDIKVSRRPEDIASLVSTQKKILNNTAECVRVGGYLLYSTCTISRAENEELITAFLRREHAFKPADLAQYLPEGLRPRVQGGCMLQLLPPVDGAEGFFMALIQRVK